MAWVWLFAAIKLVFHLVTSSKLGYFRDEFYYIACGRHLAWGYVDHAPGIALLARLDQQLLGTSLLALRLPVALAGAATVLLGGLIARALGGGRSAQALAALGALVAPIYLGTDHLFTMNSFEVLFWALAALLLVRILRGDQEGLWPWLGVAIGLGIMTKHSMAFFAGALFLGLALSPVRARLGRRGPWIAAAIALGIFLPNLGWQFAHHFPTLEFLRNAEGHKNVKLAPAEFLSALVLVAHPLNAPVWLAGVLYLLFGRSARAVRALGWAFVLLLGFFMLRSAKIYYFTPILTPMLAAGGVALERVCARIRAAWIVPAYGALLLLTAIPLVPLAVPVFPVEQQMAYINAFQKRGIGAPRMERHKVAMLPQVLADQTGWREMVDSVGAVYRALPATDRAHCTLFATNYGQAGALDFFGARYGLPPARCGHNSYWMWGPGNPADWQTAVLVGQDSADVAKTYREVRIVARTHSPYGMSYEDDQPIIVARGLKRDVREVWADVRFYI